MLSVFFYVPAHISTPMIIIHLKISIILNITYVYRQQSLHKNKTDVHVFRKEVVVPISENVLICTSRKHTYIILTPLNPAFI